MHRVERNFSQSNFTPDLPPVFEIESGDRVVFFTHDARAGALLNHRPTATAFPLPKPTPGKGNPVTGPISIKGAKPGDALLVHILSINCDEFGWCGGHAHAGAVNPGRVPEPLGRICEVSPKGVVFSRDNNSAQVNDWLSRHCPAGKCINGNRWTPWREYGSDGGP